MAIMQRLLSMVSQPRRLTGWRRFAAIFLGVFAGGVSLACAMVLLLDPYNVVPFSLPIERPLVSSNQRYMFPQVVRSGRFDSFVIGTSTSRLLDPQLLERQFDARFANLGMDAAQAWEQMTLAKYVLRHVPAPKVMLIGVDVAWCMPNADRDRITPRGFPDWLYEDRRWTALPYLLNTPTVENAGRLIGYHLLGSRARLRYDGFEVFVPPDETYDAAKARQVIWSGVPARPPQPAAPVVLSEAGRAALRFPALQWLDEILALMPPSTLKIVALVPVHIAAQPAPGTEAAATEAECKARIATIAKQRGARAIDWRIPSALTTADANFWDNVHSRLPVAQRLVGEIGAAVLQNRPTTDGSYRLMTNP
jgi:hypothetical protein